MPRPSRRSPLPLLLAALAALLVLPALDADARLSGKEWKDAEALYLDLFSKRGNPKGKASILKKIAQDESGRAYRVMAEALFKEVVLFDGLMVEIAATSAKRSALVSKSVKGVTNADAARAKELDVLLMALEDELKAERLAMNEVTKIVCEGPEILRKNILSRAKSGGEWTFRAAGLRVAVMTMKEKASKAFMLKTLTADKDPRVRMAGLDALGSAPEGYEDHVIGRLADPYWGVVLRAAAIAQERELHKAVPHLINALPKASPRVAEALAAALRKLTGENFEAYADIWSKWWADHKDDFKSDVAVKGGKGETFAKVDFYGVPIKSDRILFIIDISSSMKLKTKNENPKEKWKPPPTVTGGKSPPPPPPPEEILSGPKIDVAKHELKKAINQLPKDYMFNIICFNHGAKICFNKTTVIKGKGDEEDIERQTPTMQKASKKNKQAALTWVRQLQPRGSTYIDGALRLGFETAGLINYDKRYPDIAVDTIVLLSDGAPTDSSFPVSKLMKPEEILEHVREWNKGKQVVIHCIGVDMVAGIEFLQKLAAENGGTYVDR